ncbi:MAG: SurA N-terminal domain-containing protein, partial [Acetobacter sp.]|nr:SurA N-terminal domain-containing protein [Acetobacter sp.]
MNLRSIILARCMLSILAILLLMDITTAYATESGQPVTAKKPEPADMIVAVINSIPLTKRDVDTRGKLFALSTGLPVSQELMNRLRPQIIRQLIDERLRTQEILERHINVTPQQIAAAISNIERRNNLPKGSLIAHFKQDDLALTTLIDQLRVQIGWMQVLKQELGPRSRVSSMDIAQRQAALKREAGHPEYQ